jgi:hypothetical protein
MALLNLFHKKEKILILSMGILFSTELAIADSLSLFDPIDISKQPNILYINTQTLITNDAFSIEGLFNDFDGEFNHKTSDYIAIGDIRYDVGTQTESWGYLGFVYREEAVIDTSPDTMLLVNQSSNKLDLTLGKNYDLYLGIEGFEVFGITYANSFALYEKDGWNIQLGIGAELLYGVDTQDGYVKGDATALSENDYDFTMHSSYLYTENYLYDLDVDRVTSYGYTTHMSLYVEYNALSLSLIANDIIGKLYWDNLPYSDVNMESDNKSYDENGYVKYAPTVSGMEGTTKFTQTLMRKWRINGSYTLDKDIFQLGTEYIADTYLPYVKYIHQFDNDIIASVNYETYFGMVGVDIIYKNFHFGVHTNGLTDPTAAKVNLGTYFRF